MTEIFCALFTALVTIIGGWYTYNQKRHNMRAEQERKDLELRRLFELEEHNRKLGALNKNRGKIYLKLNALVLKTNCDRAYIVQPHPAKKHTYLSILFESLKDGVSTITEYIDNLDMKLVPKTVGILCDEKRFVLRDLEEITCPKAKSIFSLAGSNQVFIRLLNNIHGDWNGSLFVDFTHPLDKDEKYITKCMDDVSDAILYIVPEID